MSSKLALTHNESSPFSVEDITQDMNEKAWFFFSFLMIV